MRYIFLSEKKGKVEVTDFSLIKNETDLAGGIDFLFDFGVYPYYEPYLGYI